MIPHQDIATPRIGPLRRQALVGHTDSHNRPHSKLVHNAARHWVREYVFHVTAYTQTAIASRVVLPGLYRFNNLHKHICMHARLIERSGRLLRAGHGITPRNGWNREQGRHSSGRSADDARKNTYLGEMVRPWR